MLYHATYVSRSSQPLTAEGTRDIVRSAQANNGRSGITGLLLTTGDFFLQSLEGPRGALTATLSRILADTRHCDVELIEVLPVYKRSFYKWEMYKTSLDLNDPILRQFTIKSTFNPYELDPSSIRELLIFASKADTVQ
jgi:hypothetical protein